MHDDSGFYASLADNVVAKGSFTFGTSTEPFHLYAVGYPLFLAAVKEISGGFMLAIFVQILLLALSAILLYRMALRWLSSWLALIVALFYALDPEIILSNVTVITDGLFASLLIILLYELFFNRRWNGWSMFLGCGALLGYMTLVRPIGEFLFIIVPIAYACVKAGEADGVEKTGRSLKALRAAFIRSWRLSWRPMLVFILGFILIVSPWVIRNKVIFGSYDVSGVSSGNVLLYVQDFLTWKEMWADGKPLYILLSRHAGTPEEVRVEAQLHSDLVKATPPGGDPNVYAAGVGFHYILQDPLKYAYFHAVNVLPMFIAGSFTEYERVVSGMSSPVASSSTAASSSSASVNKLDALSRGFHSGGIGGALAVMFSMAPKFLETGWQILITLLAILGFIIAVKRKERLLALFGILILYFAALVGPIGNVRFRTPVEALILVLAAYGALAIYGRVIKRKEARLREATAGKARTKFQLKT